MSEHGHRRSDVIAATGISEPLVRRWTSDGYVVPSIHVGGGSGDHHLYSDDDIVLLRLLSTLRSNCCDRSVLRVVADHFRDDRSLLTSGEADALVIVAGGVLVVTYDELVAWADGGGSCGQAATVVRLG